METRANYVAVGTFVIACILALVITLLWLAGFQYSHEYEYYRTNFRGAVTGLGKGTSVRYNGIEVGRVDDLSFDPNDPKNVIVTMEIQPGLGIRTDSVSSIEPMGLTGGDFVEISGGSKNAPILTAQPGQKYPVIKSAPSALQQLTAGAPELLAKLNNIADRLTAVLSDQNQQHLSNVLANLDKTTTTLADHSNDLAATLDNLHQASNGLPSVVASADTSIKKLGKLSDDADQFVRGEGLSQLVGLIADTRRTVAGLDRLSNKLSRQPTALIFGDRRKGYEPP